MFESISTNQWFAILGFSLLLIGYVGYYFSAKNDKADELNRPTKEILNMRYMGFLWMGIIPLVIIAIFIMSSSYTWADVGVKWSFPVESWYWIAGFAAALIPMNKINAPLENNLVVYPQIREKVWNSKLQRTEYLTWFLYLLGYEWLFRGILFFSSREVMDFWPALVLNTVIYSLAHLPKGLKETIWSIPLGILLCIIVERVEVFYPAVIIHFTQAASSSYFSLRAHSEMSIVKK